MKNISIKCVKSGRKYCVIFDTSLREEVISNEFHNILKCLFQEQRFCRAMRRSPGGRNQHRPCSSHGIGRKSPSSRYPSHRILPKRFGPPGAANPILRIGDPLSSHLDQTRYPILRPEAQPATRPRLHGSTHCENAQIG